MILRPHEETNGSIFIQEKKHVTIKNKTQYYIETQIRY